MENSLKSENKVLFPKEFLELKEKISKSTAELNSLLLEAEHKNVSVRIDTRHMLIGRLSDKDAKGYETVRIKMFIEM